MERPWEQFEFWPKKITPEELKEELEKANDELRRAGNYGQRKGEDLVSKEETTKTLEGEGVKPVKISRKKNLEEIGKIIKKLEEKEG